MTSDWPDNPLMYISESDLVKRPSQEEKNNKEEKKVVGSDLVRGVQSYYKCTYRNISSLSDASEGILTNLTFLSIE